MATEQEQVCITVKAEGDLSGKQFRLMQMTNAGYGTTCLHSGTQAVMLGILQNKPAAYGRSAKICTMGLTKAVAGAAISSLGFIGAGTDGCVAAVSTESHNIIGRNLQTASGTGELIECIIDSGGMHP
ncbi:MAG: hypothetical protein ACFFD4_07675 [Candidatus Odinarchaeota archaeon]